MKKLLSILLCIAMLLSLSVAAFASDEAASDEAAVEETASDESASDETSESTATVSDSAAANPDQAITLDGVAMGQVQQLVTTASIVYDGGELDESLSTLDGVTEEDGVTYITSTEGNTNAIVIRNTGAFVLGGDSDPELVAEKINFSYITSEYYPDWEAFCDSMGYDASLTVEEIAQDMVDNGSTGSYTNLGLAEPETVVLSDYVIDLAGSGTNDMGGFGAAVYVSDNAVAELNNFRVITRGPGRGTLFTRFAATVTVNDSTFYAVSDPTISTSQGCPPGLFLEGSVRATNAVGASCVTYNNSIVISQGWGALSTDSDSLYTSADVPTELHINDSYIAVLTSGYGAYSDGGAEDYFTGSIIDTPDYAAVETGGGVVSFVDCYINVGMYGVMTHSGNSTGDIIFQNTELHVGEAGVMLRDTANTVIFDNCTIAFDGTYTIDTEVAEAFGVDIADVDEQFGTVNGVDEDYDHTIYRSSDSNCIVKLIHNSDSGSGTENSGAAPTVTISNSDMAGDILNTAAMEGDEYTATSGPAGEGMRTARSLDVTLDASSITGAISLGQDTWEVTTFASGDNSSQEIGYAASTELGAYHDEGYGLILTITNGSVWTVTETSYLTELTIDETSTIVGTMTVDGVETEIAAGTYAGEIVITPAEAAVDAETGATEEADAGETSVEEAYVEYIHEWLLAEMEVNSSLTEDQVENEFMPLIEAGDYTTFPAEMLYGGMLESGTAMTFEEFAAQY
ncbi:MAG: hypothetical protein LUE22_06685 [Oscillospiraceae bacterium]|nr:hypothetical protein [Oscillospiraceae bacterium]